MNDDIVTRLRNQCYCGPLDPDDEICDVCEAADEIERLWGALRLCSIQLFFNVPTKEESPEHLMMHYYNEANHGYERHCQ